MMIRKAATTCSPAFLTLIIGVTLASSVVVTKLAQPKAKEQPSDVEAEIVQVGKNLKAGHWRMGIAFLEHIRQHHHCNDPRLHDPAARLYKLDGQDYRAHVEAIAASRVPPVIPPGVDPGFYAYTNPTYERSCRKDPYPEQVKAENSKFKIAWHTRARWAWNRSDLLEYAQDKAAEAEALD